MTTIVEAVYENGVLKLLGASSLKEHQRYHVIVEEVHAPEQFLDPELAAERARRTTILPDGRRIVRLGGLFERAMPDTSDSGDPIADALEELRRERAAHAEAELEEFFPQEPESSS